MRARTVVLGMAWMPLVSGCMAMNGAWHGTGGPGSGHGVFLEDRVGPRATRVAEASENGLAIRLSVPAAGRGSDVPIDVVLCEGGGVCDPAGGEVHLWIRTPAGRVDELRMVPLGSSDGATHRARYRFGVAGPHRVTAEGRVGSGSGSRSVAVTSETEVYPQDGGRDGSPVPLAVLGGLGTAAMMLLMMGASAH